MKRAPLSRIVRLAVLFLCTLLMLTSLTGCAKQNLLAAAITPLTIPVYINPTPVPQGTGSSALPCYYDAYS